MKRKVTVDALWGMYRKDFLEREDGYYILDDDSGLIFRYPKVLNVLWDGSLLDPALMIRDRLSCLVSCLKLPMSCLSQMSYLCGKLKKNEMGQNVFVLPDDPEKWQEQLKDVLVKVDWDLRTDPHFAGCTEEMARTSSAVYWHEETDDYRIKGSSYVVLRLRRESLRDLVVAYSSWRKDIEAECERRWAEFEKNKVEYRQKFARVLKEWGLRNEYSLGDDELKIAREVSPGHKKVDAYRFDAVGWEKLQQDYVPSLKIPKASENVPK